MSSINKVELTKDILINKSNKQTNLQEIKKQSKHEIKSKIISLQPFKKERNIYCKEILPQSDTNLKEHNIFFTSLASLFQRTKKLQEKEKQIQNEDLRDFITKTSQIRLIIEKLEEYKEKYPKDFNNPNDFQLKSVYFLMTGKNLIIGLIYSILQSFISFSSIFLMDLITDQLKYYNGSYDQKRDLCLFLVAISVAYVLKNIFYTRYQWFQAKWQANAYATLQYLVFTKSLKTQVISSSSSQHKSEKEGKDAVNEDNPDVNNIMTADIDQQQYVFWAFIETVASTITITIVLLFIYYKIGISIYKGLYFLFGAFCLNIIVSLIFQFLYKRQIKRKGQRVSLSRDIVDGIKSIKYFGWEEIFKRKIEKIRFSEFNYVSSTRSLDSILNIFMNCTNYLLLYFILVSYVNDGHDLIDSNVFTLIALFGILQAPIGILPWSISELFKSRITYRRIQKYLNENEINHKNGRSLFIRYI